MQHAFIRTFGATGLLAASLAAFPLVAAAQSSSVRSIATATSGEQSSESTSTVSVHDGDLHAVITKRVTLSTGADGKEVRDEKIETKVTVAGKEVPSDRIQRKGDTLEVLDGKGNVIHTLTLPDSPMGVRVRTGTGSSAGAKAGAQSSGRSSARSRSSSGAGAQAGASDDENGEHEIVIMGPDGAAQGMAVMRGDAPKVMLGITMQPPEESLAKHLSVNPEEVTVVLNVTDDLPAARAGLKKFDIIVSVDGKKPANLEKIREALKTKEPGEQIKFGIVSEGQNKDVVVKLEKWDPTKLGSPRVMTFEAEGGLPVMDEHMRQVMEDLTKAFKAQGANLDFDLDQFFAPDAANGGSGFYRFVVPRQGTWQGHGQGQGQGAGPAASDDDRLRELEIRIQQLNETIRRLEERLRATQPAIAPASGPSPKA